MTIREIIQIIEDEGWFLLTVKGELRQFKHPDRKGRITLAGRLDDTVSPGALAALGLCLEAKD